MIGKILRTKAHNKMVPVAFEDREEKGEVNVFSQ